MSKIFVLISFSFITMYMVISFSLECWHRVRTIDSRAHGGSVLEHLRASGGLPVWFRLRESTFGCVRISVMTLTRETAPSTQTTGLYWSLGARNRRQEEDRRERGLFKNIRMFRNCTRTSVVEQFFELMTIAEFSAFAPRNSHGPD